MATGRSHRQHGVDDGIARTAPILGIDNVTRGKERAAAEATSEEIRRTRSPRRRSEARRIAEKTASS